MVVLDSNSSIMNSTSGNQYLSPDYLPSTLDAKNSPLALLAQTCSQIGADSSNTKPLLAALEKSKKNSAERNQATAIKSERRSPESKLAFKPYETNVLTKKSTASSLLQEATRPPSNNVDSGYDERKSNSRTSSRKSASCSPHNSNVSSEKPCSPNYRVSKSSSPTDSASNNSEQLYPKDAASSSFKPATSFPLSPAGSACTACPSTLDSANPAFRSPFVGSHFAHPALLDACFQSNPSSFVNYARLKTPTGHDAIVPFCKDPYCFSCRFSLHGAVGPCPPGCVQCDQKYTAAAAAAAALMSHPLSYQYTRPFICNWMAGDAYCGKRFRTSEELLQHLRTHTNANEALAFMNQLRYPATSQSLNSLAASARYHPYSKPASLPMSLAGSPFSAFNPALSPYYPHYSSLYDQRIGAAVNP